MNHLIGEIADIFLGSELIAVRIGNRTMVTKYVTIDPIKFYVDKEVRDRYFKSKKPEDRVHAWITGKIIDFECRPDFTKEINYHPFKHDYFFDSKENEYNTLGTLINFRAESKKGYIK